jgi:hypothetical protein
MVFHGLKTTPNGVLLSEPKRPLTECLSPLLRAATDPSRSDEIAAAWTRALALDIDEQFAAVLSTSSRGALSTTFGRMLKDGASFLTLLDDAQLDFFSDGRQGPNIDAMLHH